MAWWRPFRGWHNRNVKHARILLISALALAGCAKNIDNKEAVQAGVRKYVSGKGINVDQMDVNVNSVSFHGSQADASVAFVPKGGGSGVTANYQLERVRDEWVVKSRSAMSTADHAPGTQVPPGHGNPDGTLGSKP
jgi:hypothetical protein